ncbi:oxoglutarate/iron-dependent oxygenase [Rhodotorula toruloides]|uniref:Oxoglutarate/iron-dependent oxygenase n=1 Tax=Rhodotorula toruloides TaxID=5286 RepID=A0A511KSQ5_RHOTO|nr:oxoglutarate/iron-dependent oxygenase [Rhodotorula toruloides]
MPREIQTVETPHPAIHIVYDFVTPQEEQHLVQKIDAVGGGPALAVADRAVDEAGDGAAGGGEGTASPDGSGAAGAGAAGASAVDRSAKSWGWKELNGRRSMYWGGTVLPNSHSLIPAPFPPFMDGQWPDVLNRIAETGVFDELKAEGADRKGEGKERGANHCLVNEYLPSQGILPHTDGPAYQPLTATLSLSSHTILSLRSPPSWLSSPRPSTTSASQKASDAKEVEKVDVFLPPRSLVLLSGTLYQEWLHGIQPLEVSLPESLRGCANWEQYWASRMDACEGEEARDEVRKERVAVEDKGWKREKRISLTCRRVKGKVRKGLALGLLGGLKR